MTEPYRPVSLTHKELSAAREADPRLRTLFEQHAAFVCRSLRRLGVREADLDDMLQEVFVVVYKRLTDYEERDRAQSWLYSISARVAHAQRRRLFRRRESMTVESHEGSADATQQQRIEDSEALRFGHELLAQLPAEQREVFVLYEVEDMPMAQIARALGCPLQTAYSRLRMARARVLAEVERARSDGESP